MEKLKSYSSRFIIGGLNFLEVPRCAYQVGECGDIIFFPNREYRVEFHFITAVEPPDRGKIAEALKEAVDEASQQIKHFQFKECFTQIPETEQELYNFLFELSHSIDVDREPKSHYRLCLAHICNFIAFASGFLFRASENGSFLDGFTEPILQSIPLIQSYGTFYNQYLSCACVREKLIADARLRFKRWRRILTSLEDLL